MKIFSAVAAVVLTMSLAACSNSDSEPAQPTATVTETVQPAPQPQTEDDAFIEVVRSEHPELTYIPDSDLIELADLTCGAFDSGASVDDVLGTILASSNDPEVQESMAFVMGAGVGIYCPEHAHLIESRVSTAS